MKFTILAVAAIVILTQTPAVSQDTSTVPILRAEQVQQPKIDGVLDDPCWQNREKLTGFKVTSHNTMATEQTEVMVCCDSSTLYVAFICHDSSPSLIRAVQKQRNSDVGSDDYVTLYLDPLNTHLQHYHFTVNPLGTQSEEIPNGAAGNITWRGDWYAAAKITDSGWIAEMAIPFRVLRYPNKANTIGMAFGRYVPRIDEASYWPDLGPNNDLARYANLTDLSLPKQRGRPVFMPYTVMSRQPGDSFNQIGFDYKEEMPNNIITMMTYNPDFSDIQQAVASIDYSYTERRLSESRPFFYEGCQMFIDDEAYYSRRVGDIDVGMKTFGKVGPHSFTFLDGLKQGQANHFTSSYGYDFDRDTSVTVSYNGSTLDQSAKVDPNEPDNSMCFSSGGFRRWRSSSGTTTFNIRQFSAINSNGVPDGSMLKASLSKSESAGHFGYNFRYDDIDSTFYVRDGYVPLIGVRGSTNRIQYHDTYATGVISDWDAAMDFNRFWKHDGGLHHETVDIGGNIYLRSEWSFGGYVSSGSWLGASDRTKMAQIAWLSRHLYGGGSAGFETGKRSGEDYQYWWIDQSLMATKKIILNCQYEWSRFADEKSTQFTIQGNYEISPERNLGVWIVGRGSDTNLCCTYRQTVRSGSDVYFIYGFPNTISTVSRFAIKIVRPIAW